MARSNTVCVNFRIPLHLHERLTKEARVNNRSLNGEMITRLAQSLLEQEVKHEGDLTRPRSAVNY
ncbi:MAG TPA: Arc family DNA-binding protein [Candidatus Paceibacterota bacterium]